MAKHNSRKAQKSHRSRQSRKAQKSHRSQKSKQSRKAQKSRSRQSRQSQRGGGCAAQYNRNSFGQAGGALAEYSTGPAMLLNPATLVQAQTAQQVADFNALSGVIPQRGGMQGFAAAFSRPMMVGVAQSGAARRSNKKALRRHRDAQRGGMQEYAEAFLVPKVPSGAEMNPQFGNENLVTATYREASGTQ